MGQDGGLRGSDDIGAQGGGPGTRGRRSGRIKRAEETARLDRPALERRAAFARLPQMDGGADSDGRDANDAARHRGSAHAQGFGVPNGPHAHGGGVSGRHVEGPQATKHLSSAGAAAPGAFDAPAGPSAYRPVSPSSYGSERSGEAKPSRRAFVAGGVFAACAVAAAAAHALIGGRAPAKAPLSGSASGAASGAGASSGSASAADAAASEASAPAASGSSGSGSGAAAKAPETRAELQVRLDEAVAALERRGHGVGYYLEDLSTKQVLQHDPDTRRYSASSIKGPYCIALCMWKGAEARSAYGSDIEAAISQSDNDAYRRIRRGTYGQRQFFADFLERAGVHGTNVAYYYTDYSAKELASIWKYSREYLEGDDPTARWLAGLLADPSRGAFRDSVRSRGIGSTMSKAGWVSGGGKQYDVTCDGALVRTEKGDWVGAVNTTAADDFPALEAVVDPLVGLMRAIQQGK